MIGRCNNKQKKKQKKANIQGINSCDLRTHLQAKIALQLILFCIILCVNILSFK